MRTEIWTRKMGRMSIKANHRDINWGDTWGGESKKCRERGKRGALEAASTLK